MLKRCEREYTRCGCRIRGQRAQPPFHRRHGRRVPSTFVADAVDPARFVRDASALAAYAGRRGICRPPGPRRLCARSKMVGRPGQRGTTRPGLGDPAYGFHLRRIRLLRPGPAGLGGRWWPSARPSTPKPVDRCTRQALRRPSDPVPVLGTSAGAYQGGLHGAGGRRVVGSEAVRSSPPKAPMCSWRSHVRSPASRCSPSSGPRPGLRVIPLSVVDETRPLLGDSGSAATPATMLGIEGGGGRLMTTAIDLASAALGRGSRADREGYPCARSGPHVGTDGRGDPGPCRQPHCAVASRAFAPSRRLGSATLFTHCSRPRPHRLFPGGGSLAATSRGCESAGPVQVETDTLLYRSLSADLLFGSPALSHDGC